MENKTSHLYNLVYALLHGLLLLVPLLTSRHLLVVPPKMHRLVVINRPLSLLTLPSCLFFRNNSWSMVNKLHPPPYLILQSSVNNIFLPETWKPELAPFSYAPTGCSGSQE